MNNKKVVAVVLSVTLSFSCPAGLFAYEKDPAFAAVEESVSGQELKPVLETEKTASENGADTEETVSGSDAREEYDAVDTVSQISADTAGSETEIHGMGYNYVPGERDVESITVTGDSMEEAVGGIDFDKRLPASYRTPAKFIPELKDQGGYETCWAFSTIAAAEISMKKQGIETNPDYSELHLAYFTYNTPTDPMGGTSGDKNTGFYYPNGELTDFMRIGGNYNKASKILSSWIGAADESAAPYSSADQVINNGLAGNIAFSGKARLKNYYVVNTTATEEDRNTIKRIIRDCGAVGVSYKALKPNWYYQFNDNGEKINFEDIYSEAYNCYYFPRDPGHTDHSVTVVGWDDSFSKNNFQNQKKPEGNGAWLVRNSWKNGGSINDNASFCYDGYFWLSYYDKGLANSAAYGFEYEKNGTYDHNYQYDGGFNSGYYVQNDTEEASGRIDIANIFKVPADGGNQVLKAVSFETQNTNLDFTVNVFLNPKNDDPESGEFVSSVSGKTSCEGYYTVPLNREVALSPGNTFSVEISFKKTGEKIKAAVESNIEYTAKDKTLGKEVVVYKSTVSASPGQSYIRLYHGSKESDIGSWTDVTENSLGNVRIKAFTADETSDRYTVIFNANGGNFDSGIDSLRKVYRADQVYGKLPIPSRMNYYFDGWYTEAKGGSRITDETVASGNATYFAHWIDPADWIKKKPVKNDDGTVTYDCVWFGKYWQKDTNWDGKADRNDDKEPVKWRILSIKGDDLFLISDKVLDRQKYNTIDTDITWEKSTIRSWLNGYDSGNNTSGTDYSAENFIDEIFSNEQKEAIKIINVDNSPGQGFGGCADGGNNTKDRIYYLSGKEATTESYGFDTSDTFWDLARGAKPTDYAVALGASRSDPVYSEKHAGNTSWWLRSPGEDPDTAVDILALGCTYTESPVIGNSVDSDNGVRPVLHISSSSPFLYPAGTVCTDGTIDEKGPGEGDKVSFSVTGVKLPAQKIVGIGSKVTLTAEVLPSYASNKNVKWSSSDQTVADIDNNGTVTGVTEGTATIIVTTVDGGHTASCQVIVKEGDFEEKELTLIPGEIRRLNLNDDGQYIYGAKWTVESASPKNCVVVNNGVVTAQGLKEGVKSGEAIIKAVYGTKTCIFNINIDGTVYKNKIIKKGKNKIKISAPNKKTLTIGKNGNAKVTIPKPLRSASKSIKVNVINNDICQVGEPVYNKTDRTKASNAVFEIKPLKPGATYIEWSMADDSGNEIVAYTKVLVKKPLEKLEISVLGKESPNLEFKSVGQGVRLTVRGTVDNTVKNNPTFSFKGSGAKVSKTGYLVATSPGGKGVVTVKCGKVKSEINVVVADTAGEYLALKDISVAIAAPKSEKKQKKATLKISSPKKKEDRPSVNWSIKDSPAGLSIDGYGEITVTSKANPGCYEIKGEPQGSAGNWNTVFCELVVK